MAQPKGRWFWDPARNVWRYIRLMRRARVNDDGSVTMIQRTEESMEINEELLEPIDDAATLIGLEGVTAYTQHTDRRTGAVQGFSIVFTFDKPDRTRVKDSKFFKRGNTPAQVADALQELANELASR